MRQVATVIALFAEVLAALYLSLAAFVSTAWLLSDEQALTMSAGDWWLTALYRYAPVFAIACAFALLTYLTNTLIMKDVEGWDVRSRRLVSVALGGLVAASGLVGAVEFATTKAYM